MVSIQLEPRLVVFTGPMFSAKTMELVAHYLKLERGGYRPAAFRPARDTREPSSHIRTRFGEVVIPASTVARSAEIITASHDAGAVFIDEAQFFDDELPEVVLQLLTKCPVFISGLDLDFREQPFGPMPKLLVLAQEVHKCTAVCTHCGAVDACRTQRLRDGKPSKADEPNVVPEGKEHNVTYEPRCLRCYIAPSL